MHRLYTPSKASSPCPARYIPLDYLFESQLLGPGRMDNETEYVPMDKPLMNVRSHTLLFGCGVAWAAYCCIL